MSGEFHKVEGRCPSCHYKTLVLEQRTGHVVCRGSACPEPTLIRLYLNGDVDLVLNTLADAAVKLRDRIGPVSVKILSDAQRSALRTWAKR